MTCQSQSICIVFPHGSDEALLFDSHARPHGGAMVGAQLLFFSDLDVLCHYLQMLFYMEQPDLTLLSEMEQIQYATLNAAQADIFVLQEPRLVDRHISLSMLEVPPDGKVLKPELHCLVPTL
jgi:hypothetical protein